MRDHLQGIEENHLHTHYMGKTIQNELMAIHVKSEILKRVQEAKHYSIILDCTRDVSCIEQMSLVLRYVDVKSGNIEEHFVGFLPVEKTTGEELTRCLLTELKTLGLDIKNCWAKVTTMVPT